MAPLVDRPAVVEFDFPELEDDDYSSSLFNESVAKNLFDRVCSSLKSVASFTYLANQNRQKFSIALERDEILYKAFGANVLKRMPSPILCLSNLLSVVNAEKVRSLVIDILDTFSIPTEKAQESLLSLTLEQIVTLLDIYWTPKSEEGSEESVSLDEIRMGFCLGDIQPFRHPVGQFIMQLSTIIVENKDEDDSDSVPGRDTKPLISKQRLRDAVESLSFVQHALKKLEEAQSIMSMGDSESAAESLGEGVLNLLDFDLDLEAVLAREDAIAEQDTEHNEDNSEKGGQLIIPIALQVELLLSRAKYVLESGHVDAALIDIERAIQCDASSSAAYALRAQARLAMIQRGQMVPEEDSSASLSLLLEMVDGDESLITEQDKALHRAAEDAMIGFLLSGSSDINQASLAEELAKETVRSFSRNVFHNRRQKLLEVLEQKSAEQAEPVEELDLQPKPWLIGSYLSSYPLLSKSLHLSGRRTVGEELRRERLQSAQQCDIDETNYTEVPNSESELSSLPPDHLLDLKANQPQYAIRREDVHAYDLLVQLVDKLEAFGFGDASQPLPESISQTGSIASQQDLDPFAVGAEVITVDQVYSVADLGSGGSIVEKESAEQQSVLTFAATPSQIQNAWRLLHVGVSELLPVADSDRVSSNQENLNSTAQNEENFSVAATEAKVGEVMELARFAAVVAGVKLDPRRFMVMGFDFAFEPEPLTKHRASSFNNHLIDHFDHHHHHQHRSSEHSGGFGEQFFGQRNQPFGFMNAHFEEDDEDEYSEEEEEEDEEERNFSGFMAEKSNKRKREATVIEKENEEDDEDEWEDCDDDEDEEEDEEEEEKGTKNDSSSQSKPLPTNNGDSSSPIVIHKSDMGSPLSGAHTKYSTQVDAGEDTPKQDSEIVPEKSQVQDDNSSDEDFDRLASLVGEISLSRGASLNSKVSAAALEEAFADNTAEEEEEEAGDAQIVKSEVEDEAVGESDIDVSIDELIDALQPLASEELSDEQQQEHSVGNEEDAPIHLPAESQPVGRNHDTEQEDTAVISSKLRSRLLNLVGSLAYLVGDAVGASHCFEASLQFDADLQDSRIKLGALFVDLDEPQRAFELLSEAQQRESSAFSADSNSGVALLHLGQWALNESDFGQAADFLRRANRAIQFTTSNSNNRSTTANSPAVPASAASAASGAATSSAEGELCPTQGHVANWVESVQWQERCERRHQHAQTQIHANALTLLAVATFRQTPTEPEVLSCLSFSKSIISSVQVACFEHFYTPIYS